MKLTRYFEADAYVVVVLAVSTVLFVACFCLLIRAYRRKHRSRGKQKELQRPFIKGKRSSLSPKKSPLLGNLQLYNGQTLISKVSPKQQLILLPQKSSPVRTSIKASSPNHSSDNSKLLEDKTWEPNFLGEVIASINQQQCQESSAAKMLSRKKKMREPKVKFRSHNLSTGSGVHDHDGCVGSEGGDQSVEANVQISLGVNERGDNKTHRTDPVGASPNQTAAKAEYDLTPSSDASQDMNSVEFNVINSAEQTTSVILTPEQGTSKLFRVKWKKPVTLLQSNLSALSSADISAQRPDQLWAHKCNCKSNLKKMTTRWMNRLHWKPSSVKGWAGDSSTNKDPKNAIQPHCNGDPRVESSVHVETTINESFSQGNGHNGSVSDRNSCANTCSSEDVSREHADRSQQTEGTRTVTADVKPDVCPHAIPNSASVASSAPKNEVYCRLCGMTLSKPQCFYSLGSLCTDEEICETDSDDINRHPVGDINVNIVSPLVEVPAYNNDTGYTSTDEFENDLASHRLYERTDNGSYDGDYESDNEDTVDKQVAVGDDQVVKPLASIGEPIAIIDYALREWKSDTPTSQAMKKGYTSISSVVNCHHLRQIRGDNYCSIRAVLFQALVSGLPILNRFEARKDSKLDQIPSRLSGSKDTRLDQWSFANRFPVPQAEVKATLENFLTFFGDQIHRILECCSGPERVDATLAMFSEETQEFKVLEATKLLMYDTAVELFNQFTSGEDVPVFAMLLFARDSSDLPRMFLKNHLNKTGDSGGLEQVEMCLLGYTLGVVIQVIRPSQVDKDDFIAYYPSLDDVPKYTPTVTLVAEDDRHYNIVL